MNRLKALFVPLLIAIAMTVGSNGLPRLFGDTFSMAWLGASVTALTILFFFLNLYRFTTPRTTPALAGFTTAVSLGTLLSLIGQLLPNTSLDALLSTITLTIGWILYVYWYSSLDRSPDTMLAAGSLLPDFVVEDEAGKEVHSGEWLGQPTLLMFFRGNWCPLCMAQIREVAANYRELAQRGVLVILISPQSHNKTRRLAEKFDVPMRFLVDVDNRVARQLKIEHENGVPTGTEILGYKSETVLPTMLMTDENGRILHLDLTDNYRLRPDPAIFLQTLDKRELQLGG